MTNTASRVATRDMPIYFGLGCMRKIHGKFALHTFQLEGARKNVVIIIIMVVKVVTVITSS